MTDVTALLSIGELATRTGLPVRTIRFYSDSGVVPPARRTDAGYRLYDADALARLGLVRALRDLGIDSSRPSGACSSARSPCATSPPPTRRPWTPDPRPARPEGPAASRGRPTRKRPTGDAGHAPTRPPSDDERRRIVADFLDQAFEGLDIEPGFAARMRSATPALPDDPTTEQVDAWIELAELVQDDDFRRTIRRMSEQHAAAREAGAEPGDGEPRADLQAAAALVAETGEGARDAGIAPGSPERRGCSTRSSRPSPARRTTPDPAWHRARRPARRRHRRACRALLAAAGDRQRVAAGGNHGLGLAVADRGAAPARRLDERSGERVRHRPSMPRTRARTGRSEGRAIRRRRRVASRGGGSGRGARTRSFGPAPRTARLVMATESINAMANM